MIGCLVILIGVFLVNFDRSFTLFLGGFLIIIGFQLFFWALHIRSEFLGNMTKKPNNRMH